MAGCNASPPGPTFLANTTVIVTSDMGLVLGGPHGGQRHKVNTWF